MEKKQSLRVITFYLKTSKAFVFFEIALIIHNKTRNMY